MTRILHEGVKQPMPTNNKTPNIGLNSWISTDKPKRTDFVADNSILDTVISAHLNDHTSHITGDERTRFLDSFIIGGYAGSGDASMTISLSIEPRFVLVYLRNSPFTQYDSTNSYMLCNAGMSAGPYGKTTGVTLQDNELTVQQTQGTPSNGVFLNLNKENAQYVYIVFK